MAGKNDHTFSISDVEALASIFRQEDQADDDHVYGSVLNPSSLHGGKEGKELAKPGVKMNAVVNNRNPTGGANIPED